MRPPVERQELVGIDRGVDLGGCERRVPEQFLDGAQLAAPGQQMGGKRMAERMRGCR